MQIYYGIDTDLRVGLNPSQLDFASLLYPTVKEAGPIDSRFIELYGGGYNGIDFGIWDSDDITFLDDPELLGDHLAKVETDIPLYVPADFDGLIVIDLEGDWNLYNYPNGYLDKIKAYFLGTIEKVRELRPNASVSWYGYPYALGSVYEEPANAYSARNDDLSWLYREMDFLAPAIYRTKRRRDESETGTLGSGDWTPEDHRTYVRSNLAEFRRIGTNNKRPIFIHETAFRIADGLPEGTDLLTQKEIEELAFELQRNRIEGLIWWGYTSNNGLNRALADWWRNLYIPSLQKYALVANDKTATKLNFVNRVLRSAGYSEVSQLRTGQTDDAGIAERWLDWADMQVQSGTYDGTGWWKYNTRRGVPATSDPSGRISIPSYVIDTKEAWDEPLALTKIGGDLVNLDPELTGFGDTQTIIADLCLRYHLDCCPWYIQQAIVAIGAMKFYESVHRRAGYSETIMRQLRLEAEAAIRRARAQDTRMRRSNIIKFDRSNYAPRWNSTSTDD